MTKSRLNIKIYLWTIPILLLSGLIVYLDNSLNRCSELVHAFGDIFLLLVLFLFIVIFIIIQIYKTIKHTESRKSRIWSIIIVVIATLLAFQGNLFWKEIRFGNSILSASIYPDQLDIGQIELLDNKKYYALYGHIDWSCAFTDSYQKHGDTLILNGAPFKKSNGILADKYILTDSTLIPIKTMVKTMKRTEIMKIKKRK